MFLFRLLLLLVAAYLIWRLWRHFARPRVTPPAKDEFLPMTRCARCGAHVAAGALSAQGLCGRCATPPA